MNAKIKKTIVAAISYLYILLFVYAAVSKILDFENFGVQLGQSPLLSAFAQWIKWMVPITEIIISGLLAFPKTRHFALYCAFTLMVMFTAYIYIILNFSSFVPCSCGGILEKLGWQEHLVFNIAFIILAATGIIISHGKSKDPKKPKMTFALFCCSAFAVIIIALLFQYSEQIMHHKNNFIRRFPPYAVIKTKGYPLQFNSYYIAGADNQNLYLSNYTAPAEIIIVDSKLKQALKKVIDLKDAEKIPFRSVSVKVVPPYFYVIDGNAPCVFRGTIADWKGNPVLLGSQRFSATAIIDSNTLAFRTRSKETAENILGTISFSGNAKPLLSTQLLQKQFDGVFDTDGTLHYSKSLGALVYTYYYRNQFIVADKHLSLSYRGNTIDTTTKAKLKVVYLEKQKSRKFGAPPNTVNAFTAVHDNLLFVNSTVQGRFETSKMWRKASVIDVYDMAANTYKFSFYVNKVNGRKLSGFAVTDTNLYVIYDTEVVAYKLGKAFTKNGGSNSHSGLKASR